MTPLEIGILLLLSLLWGGSFFFVEILVPVLPPLTIVFVRVALAAIVLWAIVLATHVERPTRLKDWGDLVIIGLLNNALPFCLIVWGQTQIESGLASILNATAPLFTILVAGALLADENLTRTKLVGVMLGLTGVIGLIGPDALSGFSGSLLGQLAVVGAALSYAFAGVFARRFSRNGISPLMVATGQVTMAALLLLPLTLWIDGVAFGPYLSVTTIGALLGLALFSTVLAYTLYFKLIASAGATNAALVTFLIPVSAIALGATFLGERLTPTQFVGAALIGAGLLVIDGRVFSRS